MSPKIEQARCKVSQSFFLIALALLVFSAVLVAAIWIKAAANDMIPSTPMEGYQHGPWRPTALRSYVGLAIFLPLFASGASLLSLIIKPSIRAGGVLLIGFLAFWIIAGTHFWLID